MTQLQDEILKLLKESMLTEDELKEVTFDKITDQMKDINVKNIEDIISGPLAKVKANAEAAVASLNTALNAYNAVETFYNEKMGNGKATQISPHAPIEQAPVTKATSTEKGTITNNNTTPVNNNNINTNASNNTTANNSSNVSNGNSSRSSSFSDWANRIGNGIRNLMNNGNNSNVNTNNNSFQNQNAYQVDEPTAYGKSVPAAYSKSAPGPISMNPDGSITVPRTINPKVTWNTPDWTQNVGYNINSSTPEQVAPTTQPIVQAPEQAQVVQPQVPLNAQSVAQAPEQIQNAQPQATTTQQAASTPQPVTQVPTAAPVTTKRKGRPAKATKKTAAESFDESDLELQTEGIGDMIGNWQANRRDKQAMIDYLNDATTMLTQANTQITQAKQQYGIVYKQLNDLSEKIKNARKLIEKKKSWFGRAFGFWKGSNNTNNNA